MKIYITFLHNKLTIYDLLDMISKTTYFETQICFILVIKLLESINNEKKYQ